MLRFTQSVVFGAVLLVAGSATAVAGTLAPCETVSGNLVSNCGFESGDFGPWSTFDATDNIGVGTSSPTSVAPNSGTFLAYFGQVDSTGGITQMIPTVAGQAYDISFYLQNDGPDNGEGGPGATFFDISFDGGSLYSESQAPAYGFTQFTFTGIVASSDNTPISFTFQQAPAYYSLDDVVVTASAPEPGSIGLIGVGLIGLSLILRRRKKS